MGKSNTGSRNSGCYNSGHSNSGLSNSGHYNSGYYNSGSSNIGDYNSGYYNTGNFNGGHSNSGTHNSGSRNSGARNSGAHNNGNFNSGDYNTGNYNSGNFNSGDYNNGWFNTNEPKMRIFNKASSYTYSELCDKNLVPSFRGFDVNVWVRESIMTEKEKTDNPTYKITGGYLKTLEYKEAWAIFWRKTDEANRQKFLNLPNFDADIFKEITGVDVDNLRIKKND
jgi:hypothetical protein